jgi:hypothetical protein
MGKELPPKASAVWMPWQGKQGRGNSSLTIYGCETVKGFKGGGKMLFLQNEPKLGTKWIKSQVLRGEYFTPQMMLEMSGKSCKKRTQNEPNSEYLRELGTPNFESLCEF